MSTIPRGQTPERKAYMKAYAATHPRPDRRAYKAAYDLAHRAESSAYRRTNADRIRESKRAHYQANRERLLAAVKARAIAMPEAISMYHAEHYAKNSARIKGNVKAYRKRFPEKKAHLENRRRTRKTGNGGSHTLDELKAKFAACGNVCHYCGCGGKLTRDHVIPLKRGGTDDIDNIVPACRSCNSKKSTKTAAEFTRTGGVGGSNVAQGR